VSRFLVVFDRRAGITLEVREVGALPGAAISARLDAEEAYMSNKSVEVVVLSADSEESLLRTHSRYFENVRELVARATSSMVK
jgi:hypothetical protein